MTRTPPPPHSSGPAAPIRQEKPEDARAKRRAQALRDNLRRRKRSNDSSTITNL